MREKLKVTIVPLPIITSQPLVVIYNFLRIKSNEGGLYFEIEELNEIHNWVVDFFYLKLCIVNNSFKILRF
jgi:hypothetical protein